jgi:DNA-binding transcriptional regulator LsrR (DeoR family)
LRMQSKTEKLPVELEVHETDDAEKLKSFKLYEEYSQRNIAETIRIRKDTYEKTAPQAKEELITAVEIEVENFHIWLEAVKKLEPFDAHYYSISLKSLLLGVPIGVQVAQLFDEVLNRDRLSI